MHLLVGRFWASGSDLMSLNESIVEDAALEWCGGWAARSANRRSPDRRFRDGHSQGQVRRDQDDN